MGHALYRKYRPTTLSDVVGQDHITKSLNNAIKQDKIAHAYLFTGPRGVGKTSVARILAHEINKQKYSNINSSIDIIEIDAASNRGVEEIRDLREKVHIAPTSSKYKIYIIDEVHMMTTFAFNAFLKTLEEPPEHAVFILATTDAHKLPETIISRTQRFNFKAVDNKNIVKQLSKIAKKENINISEEALVTIAEHAEGSFRDAISMLDQLQGNGKSIDNTDVFYLLGVPDYKITSELIKTLDAPESLGDISSKLDELYTQGFQASKISEALILKIREDIISTNNNATQKLSLMNQLIEVPSSYNPARYLEITLLNYAQNNLSNIPAKTLPEKKEKPRPLKTVNKQVENSETVEHPEEIVYDSQLSEDVFTNLLQQLKKKYNTLYSIVRMAEHEYIDNELVLTFKFAFHQKRVSEEINQKIITELLNKITGSKSKLTCLLNQSQAEEVTKEIEQENNKNNKSEDIKTLSNIFGGAELLES